MFRQENVLSKAVVRDLTNEENRSLIVKSVLDAYGAGMKVEENFNGDIRTYEHSLLGNNENYLLVFIQFDKKNTIGVIYREEGESYLFFSVLGRFYEIKDIFFIEEPNSKNTMILLKEKVNMALGAYETNEFLKGFLWNGNFFYQVLNAVYTIEAYWNTAWTAYSDKKQWERAAQSSNFAWNNSQKLILYLYETQEYCISSVEDEVNLPASHTFQPVQSRFVIETYIWNEKWGCFILYESQYKISGETVAVVQDLNNSIYSLVEDLIRKYVIYTPQKELLVVSEEDLELRV